MGVAVSPLARTVIELLPLGGLDQDKAKFIVAPFHRLENVIFDRTGSLLKRPGFVEMSDAVTDVYALGVPEAASANGAELLAFGDREEESASQPGEPGAYAWSYAPTADAWVPKTGLPSLSVRRMPGVRGQEDLDDTPPVIARIGSVEAVAWRVGTKAYVRIVDRATGAVLINNDELVGSLAAGPAGKIALFACGGVFCFVYLNATKTQVRQGTVDPTTLAASSATLATVYASIAYWDAIPTATGKWCFAGLDATGTGDVVLQRVDVATATADATTAEIGRANTLCSLGFVSGYAYLLLAWDDGTDVRAKHYVESTLVTAIADWQVEPTATFSNLYGISCNFDDSHRSFVLMDATSTSNEDKLYFRVFDNLGASLVSTRQINHVSAQVKPFRLNGALYALVCRHFLSNLEVGQSFGYALVNLSRRWNEVGNNYPAALEGSFAPLDGRGLDVATSSQHYAWIDQDDGKAWLPIVIFSANGGAPITSPEARSWVDVIELDSSESSERLWHRQTAQSLFHLTAGITTQYDGQTAAEVAWLEPPQVIGTPSLTYGASGLEGVAGPPENAYTYYFIWEWIDAQGLIHRSRLSDSVIVNVGVSGMDTHALVDFVIKTTNLTRRGSAANGAQNKPRLAAFRTLKNTSGPFYRCLWTSGAVNATGDWSIAWQDGEDDATLEAAARGQIYTSGGVLENYAPPPARHVAVGGGRVWLTSAESREVWPSKELVNGEAPAFSPDIRITVDAAKDELVATAQLDTARVIFSRSQIFALPSGNGPTAAGGGVWPTPEVVQSSCGCISARSVVEFRDGVIFRAVDAFKLMTRGFQIVDIGEAVCDITDAFPTVCDAFLDAARERVIFYLTGDSGGGFLVYDYRHTTPEGAGSWSQWTFSDAGAGRACLWQEQIVWAQGGTINLQSGGAEPGWDTIGGVQSWVPGVIETPWIRVGALGGYQRTWRAVLELEKLSAHGLQVDLFVDGDDTTAVQTETWSEAQIDALQGLPRERIVIGLARQKCQSIKIRLTDTEPAAAADDAVTGYRYHGLSLEIGRKRGVEKAEKANWRLAMLPLAIAGGTLAAAGIYSAYKGYKAGKSTPNAQAPAAAPVHYGGSGMIEGQLRKDISDRDALATQDAQRYRGMADQSRAAQAGLLDRYGAMERGEGPSLAQQQLQQGLSSAQQQANQQAASVGGGAANQLVAQRMAQQTGAGLAGQVAGQAAQLRQQEQLAAMQAQAQLAGQMREGDYAGAQMGEQRAGQAFGARMGMEGDIYRGKLGQAQADQQANIWAQEQNIARRQAEADRWWKLGGSLLSSGASVGSSGLGGGKLWRIHTPRTSPFRVVAGTGCTTRRGNHRSTPPPPR